MTRTLRNVFDQYTQPENKITHALATLLNEDPVVLRRFIRLCRVQLPKGAKLTVLEQRLPGELEEAAEDSEERSGLPDLWIHDEDQQWSLVVESKVQAGLTTDQLRRHRATARRRGFKPVHVVALTAVKPAKKPPAWCHLLLWVEVYEWARRQHGRTPWARRFTDYLEIAEIKMSNRGYLSEGQLTTFCGVPFDETHPYNYGEAKRVLRLMTEELRKRKDLRKLGIDAAHPGRSAIKGSNAPLIWDYIPLKGLEDRAFTSAPHLSYSLGAGALGVKITIPNGIRRSDRRKLVDLGEEGFLDLLSECGRAVERVTGAAGGGALPEAYLQQRHFLGQRSTGFQDAEMRLDLRTLATGGKTRVKVQVEWAQSMYQIWCNKASNMQMGVGAAFPYGPSTQGSKVLDHVAGTWLACRPLIMAVSGTT